MRDARITHFISKPHIILVHKAATCRIVLHYLGGKRVVSSDWIVDCSATSICWFTDSEKKGRKKHKCIPAEILSFILSPIAKFHAQMWQF